MTYSPIISAAGTDPDSAATDPAGVAVDPAAAVPDPAVGPDSGSGPGQPATGASRAGANPGQAGSPTSQASASGYAAYGAYPTGQAATEQGAYPTGQAAADQGGHPTGQAAADQGAYPAGKAAADQRGYPADQGGAAVGQADSAVGQADSAVGYADRGAYSTGQGGATGQGGYSAAEQGGYSATEQGAYASNEGAANQAGSSADAAGSAANSGQQDDAGTAWPHQTFLELGALTTAAPCARLHTTLVLWEWDLGTLVHSAGLVVSELVSNAVQASAGLTGSRFAGVWTPGTPPVRMWLSADDQRVVIQVWDGSDRPPVPQPVEPEADRGRGLLLVGALSAEWGCYTPEKCSGKVVWAVVGD